MKKEVDKKESKGCLIVAAIVFGLSAIKPLITLIFGGDPTNMKAVDTSTGDVYDVISNLRMNFIGLILAVIYYLWAHFFKQEGKE